MIDFCRRLRRSVRYFLFPESQLVDERTAEIDQQRRVIRHNVGETKKIVSNANQPDTLRNLVAAMTSDRSGRRYDHR